MVRVNGEIVWSKSGLMSRWDAKGRCLRGLLEENEIDNNKTGNYDKSVIGPNSCYKADCFSHIQALYS